MVSAPRSQLEIGPFRWITPSLARQNQGLFLPPFAKRSLVLSFGWQRFLSFIG
jgi:hypothetical protein